MRDVGYIVSTNLVDDIWITSAQPMNRELDWVMREILAPPAGIDLIVVIDETIQSDISNNA